MFNRFRARSQFANESLSLSEAVTRLGALSRYIGESISLSEIANRTVGLKLENMKIKNPTIIVSPVINIALPVE